VATEGVHRRGLRRPFAVLLSGPQVKRLTTEARSIVVDVLGEIEDDEIDLMADLAWSRRNTEVAKRCMHTLMKRYDMPRVIITDQKMFFSGHAATV
jgi:hypothetical protein